MNLRERMPFLSAAENRESFFRRITMIYVEGDDRYLLIKKAYEDAKDAFREVKRDEGCRYFEHLRAVALILIDYLRVVDHKSIVAALLHDIIEDRREWPYERVCNEYGEDIACLVNWVTKPSADEFRGDKERRNHVYHTRLSHAPRSAIIIKLADRLHNILTISACPPEKIARKVEETKLYYLPLAEREIILIHELEEGLAALAT